MEWIRISNNKLKIMLSAEDTKRYELNCEAADIGDAMTRAAFREILSDVQHETGFDAAEDKVYIQMYPSKEGGCELFITRIGLLLSDETDSKSKPARAQERRRRSNGCAKAFYFAELEALLSLCRRLSKSTQISKSELWRDENGGWWLLLTHATALFPSLFKEYGKEIPRERAELFLSEHGTRICDEHAVGVMGML